MSDFNDLVGKAIELVNSEKYDEAMELAKNLQELKPDNADGYHLQALCCQYRYEWENSITALNKAIECSPYDANLYNARGFAYMSLGNYDNSHSDFEEAIKLEDLEQAHRYKALWYILQDQSEEGIAYLITRLKANPGNVENWLFMGDLMSRAGFEDKALTYYQQAQKIDPNHPDVKNQNLQS